jgi:formaldehyde-activating enzyme involved in methanogenesis
MIRRLITATFVLVSLGYLSPMRAQEFQDSSSGVVRIHNTKRDAKGAGVIVRIQKDRVFVVIASYVVEGGRYHEVYRFNQRAQVQVSARAHEGCPVRPRA